jgi:hypothetical protein
MTKIIGKHRELLVELLIYYMNKDSHNHIQFAYFINEEEPMGRYWTKCYIDEYKDRAIPWDPNTNNNAGY